MVSIWKPRAEYVELDGQPALSTSGEDQLVVYLATNKERKVVSGKLYFFKHVDGGWKLTSEAPLLPRPGET